MLCPSIANVAIGAITTEASLGQVKLSTATRQGAGPLSALQNLDLPPRREPANLPRGLIPDWLSLLIPATSLFLKAGTS